jgi:hypothetical protein
MACIIADMIADMIVQFLGAGTATVYTVEGDIEVDYRCRKKDIVVV